MSDTTLTPAQKAGRTNHERSEQRKARFQKELEEVILPIYKSAQNEETQLIRDAANAVLKSTEATPSEKLRAAEILTKFRRY